MAIPDLTQVKEGDQVTVGSQTFTKTPEGGFVLFSTNQGDIQVTQDQKTLDFLSNQNADPNSQNPGKNIQYNPNNPFNVDSSGKPLQGTGNFGGPTGKPATPITSSENSVTYINPATGQTQKLDPSQLTPDTVSSLQNQGYNIMETSGVVPSWITSGNVEQGKAQAEADRTKADLDSLKSQLAGFTVSDSQLQGQINGITAQWDARIKQMEDVNKRREQTINTLGIRMGSQYTGGSGGMFGGIVAEEERQGVMRIGELEGQKQAAITAAREAARTKNWDVFSKQVDLAEKAYQEKQTALKDLNKQAIENSKKANDQAIQASRDSAIADLISQGISDPSQILNLLNLDSKGNQIGDFTASEVAKTIKDFTVSGDAKKLPQDIETFNWLKNNNKLPSSITSLPPEKQYFAYLNMQKLAEQGKLGELGTGTAPGVTVGAGANNPTEELAVRSRLFSKLMNILNKGQVSDSDRKIIDERITAFRNAGWSEQKIMDTLSGFPADVTTPYNNTFRDLIVQNTDTLDMQTQLMGKVALLLNNKNYKGAMTAVENQAMNNAKKLDPDNYMGTATVNTYLTKVEKIKSLLNEGGVVGFISGNFQNLLGRIKGTNATQIKSDLTSLYAQFRKEYLGSAVTPSEEKFLAPLLADISDTKGNFLEKLNSFERNTMYKYNSTRSSVNLPEVGVDQITSPDKRLNLYQGTMESSNPFSDSLGKDTNSNSIYDATEGYKIPEEKIGDIKTPTL